MLKWVVKDMPKSNLLVMCSGLIKPDINQGGNIITIEEVFNDQKAKSVYPGIQARSSLPSLRSG